MGVAVLACYTGVLCSITLAAGVFGGGKLGSRLGNGKNVFFTIMGQNDDGSNYAQSFRFINKKTAKKLQKELIKFTGYKWEKLDLLDSYHYEL